MLDDGDHLSNGMLDVELQDSVSLMDDLFKHSKSFLILGAEGGKLVGLVLPWLVGSQSFKLPLVFVVLKLEVVSLGTVSMEQERIKVVVVLQSLSVKSVQAAELLVEKELPITLEKGACKHVFEVLVVVSRFKVGSCADRACVVADVVFKQLVISQN